MARLPTPYLSAPPAVNGYPGLTTTSAANGWGQPQTSISGAASDYLSTSPSSLSGYADPSQTASAMGFGSPVYSANAGAPNFGADTPQGLGRGSYGVLGVNQPLPAPTYPSFAAGIGYNAPAVGGGMGWSLDGNGGNSAPFSNATAEFGADTASGLGGSNAGWNNPFAVNEQGLNGLGMTNFDTLKGGIGLLTSGVNAYSALQGVGLAKKQFAASQDQWNKTWGAQTKIHNNQVASDARFADAYSGTKLADQRIKERSI